MLVKSIEVALILVFSNSAHSSIYDNESAKCLAVNVYHEARGENIAGQMLVADVVLNRVESKKYPNEICDVVTQSYQFSWFNDLEEVIEPDRDNDLYYEIYKRCRNMIYNNHRRGSSNGSLFYHHTSIKPHWSKKMIAKLTVGNHIFY